MFFKNFYQDKSDQEILAEIKKEGFDPLKITNEPGYIYSAHKHPETKVLAFLKGSMKVTVNQRTYLCRPFDKLIVPGDTVHQALVGDKGCTFFWAEKVLGH